MGGGNAPLADTKLTDTQMQRGRGSLLAARASGSPNSHLLSGRGTQQQGSQPQKRSCSRRPSSTTRPMGTRRPCK